MEKEKNIRERFRIFKKLTRKLGYDTEKKILDMNIEDFLLLENMPYPELLIIIGIKKSLKKNMLVSYLNGLEIDKNNDKDSIKKEG